MGRRDGVRPAVTRPGNRHMLGSRRRRAPDEGGGWACGPGPGSCWSTVPSPKTAGRPRQGPVLLAARPSLPETGHGLPARMCVPRKQEELVQQVRKRLEEALMADMLAHVEELARDGEAPLDKPGADEDDEDEDEDEEPDQDADMEHI